MTTEVTNGQNRPRPDQIDQVFEVLSDARRRYVLKYVSEAGSPVPREELVEAVTAWERTPADEKSRADARKLVATVLHHTHLPKLEEAGFLEQTSGGVRTTTAAERALSALWTELTSVSDDGNDVVRQ